MKDNMNTIGLKDLFKRNKGNRLRWKLHNLKYELKYALQRAWLGYDNRDVWACESMFQERMILILKEFRNTHYCLWWVPEESEHYNKLGYLDNVSNKRCFNEEETDTIIDMMIWHLKMMDDDFVEKQLFGTCIEDDDYIVGLRTHDDYLRIFNVREQNKKCFMKLFNLFYYDLWD